MFTYYNCTEYNKTTFQTKAHTASYKNNVTLDKACIHFTPPHPPHPPPHTPTITHDYLSSKLVLKIINSKFSLNNMINKYNLFYL